MHTQTDSTATSSDALRERYVKPELREYGAIADLTAAVGTNAMPDGGVPLANMSVST